MQFHISLLQPHALARNRRRDCTAAATAARTYQRRRATRSRSGADRQAAPEPRAALATATTTAATAADSSLEPPYLRMLSADYFRLFFLLSLPRLQHLSRTSIQRCLSGYELQHNMMHSGCRRRTRWWGKLKACSKQPKSKQTPHTESDGSDDDSD